MHVLNLKSSNYTWLNDNRLQGKFYPEILTPCVTSANTDIEMRVDKKAIK